MYDIDYVKWLDYIEAIFSKYGKKPSTVLDLACGTGSFTIEMAKKGYEMIGVDISSEMLSCARKKSETANCEILYLNQDISCLDLYGTVDAVVCLMDSINYITGKRELSKVFRNVYTFLNPDGLFIFDINTEGKLENELGNNVFYEVNNDITYIWQNTFDSKKRICEFDLTFFVRRGDMFERFDETHYERAYTVDELKEMLNKSGLQVLNIYHNLSFKIPGKNSDRIFFVCVKR